MAFTHPVRKEGHLRSISHHANEYYSACERPGADNEERLVDQYLQSRRFNSISESRSDAGLRNSSSGWILGRSFSELRNKDFLFNIDNAQS